MYERASGSPLVLKEGLFSTDFIRPTAVYLNLNKLFEDSYVLLDKMFLKYSISLRSESRICSQATWHVYM